MLRHIENLKKTFFLKNLIIFLIPSFLLVFVLFHFLGNEMSNRALENYQRQFDGMCNSLNNNFTSIQSFSSQLSNSSWVKQLFLHKYDVFQTKGQDIYSLNSYSDNLSSYKTSNNFINQIAVYFLQGKYILSTKGVFFNTNNLYPLKPVNISSDVWLELLSKNKGRRIISATNINVIGSTDEGILYIQSIPYFVASPRAVVISFIQKKVLESTINESIIIENGMYLEITDINGYVIYDTKSSLFGRKKDDKAVIYEKLSEIAKNQNQDVGYVRYGSDYIFGKTSYKNGLSYYLYIPQKDVYSKSLSLYTVSLYITLTIIFITILVGGVILIRYISRIEYKPVAELIQRVEDVENTSFRLFQIKELWNGKNEYQIINSALYHVNNIFEDLSKRIEDDKYKVQKLQLLEFLTNDVNQNKDGITNLMPSGDFCCFAFKTKDMIEDHTVQELFSTLVVDKQLTFTTLEYNSTFIIFVHGISKVVYDAYIKQVRLLLQPSSETKITIGCSNVEISTQNAKRAFFQAIKALEYTFINENDRVIQYSQIFNMENKKYYIYNIEMDSDLLDSLKAGAQETAISIVKESIKFNLEKHQVSIDAIKHLLGHFINIAYNVANEMNIYDEIKARLTYEDIKVTISEELEFIYKIYGAICETICLKKSSNLDYLKQTLIDYIDKNFDNPNLSLKTVASDFGYSAPYFCKVFKSIMKQGFMQYIHYKRLQIAKDLLVTNNLSIIEISRKVGYSSDITFRRMFKKQERISASEFRAYHYNKP